jgi:hypothetical protein
MVELATAGVRELTDVGVPSSVAELLIAQRPPSTESSAGNRWSNWERVLDDLFYSSADAGESNGGFGPVKSVAGECVGATAPHACHGAELNGLGEERASTAGRPQTPRGFGFVPMDVVLLHVSACLVESALAV